MEFVPDVALARVNSLYYGGFHTYSRAYICTNEDLRNSMKYVPKNCNRALVAAASGDHPLFCSLYGAKDVDTFDISYNAKCIMDIKTAAMRYLGYSDYLDLLRNLCYTKDIKNVEDMDVVSENLSQIEYNYLCAMQGHRLFSHGNWYGEDNDGALKKKEYEKLQKVIKKPYNFILTDIDDLSTHLTGKYDFMHFSNIFDYADETSDQFDIIFPMLNYVNVGGRIVIQHLCDLPWTKNPFLDIDGGKEAFENWTFFKKKGDVSIFERVR